ncbi:hypothetical protein [Sediminibacillus massiliensis]|nr:hypothetical protein [Sediminibacillus massiliensis]
MRKERDSKEMLEHECTDSQITIPAHDLRNDHFAPGENSYLNENVDDE